MKALGRNWLVGVALTATVGAIAAKVFVFTDAWRIEAASGAAECMVRRGWTQGRVAQSCGPADRVGIQPKVPSGRPPGYFCSAPCEVRRDRIVFFDCNGGVSGVGRVDRRFTGGCNR